MPYLNASDLYKARLVNKFFTKHIYPILDSMALGELTLGSSSNKPMTTAMLYERLLNRVHPQLLADNCVPDYLQPIIEKLQIQQRVKCMAAEAMAAPTTTAAATAVGGNFEKLCELRKMHCEVQDALTSKLLKRHRENASHYCSGNPFKIGIDKPPKLNRKAAKNKSNSNNNDDYDECEPAIKCVYVGDAAVGKTSLLTTFATNSFPSTHYTGTVFENYSISLQVDENTKVSIAQWDSAGQPDYNRLRPLSYPDTNVFLVCYAVDNYKSLQHVEQVWAHEIDHFCSDTIKILVGCKRDLRDAAEQQQQQQSQQQDKKSKSETQKFVTFEEAYQVAKRLKFHGVGETAAINPER